MNETQQHVKWFRDSSPYINAHRGRTFVVYVGSEGLDHENLNNIIGDIVLLHSLGVRLVFVHGAAIQISRHTESAGKHSQFESGIRITTAEILPLVQEVIGRIRTDIESKLSMGLINSPQHGADIVVTSGNYLRARPLGIRDGIDFEHTGEVRKVNAKAIRDQLDQGAIVLVSPLGYSKAGEIFNINSLEVAREVASALLADKLIYLTAEGPVTEGDAIVSELQVGTIEEAALDPLSPLAQAKRACIRGVGRCHLLSHDTDGALLEELFTRDGAGTQVVRQSYEMVRKAEADDIGGIIELIRPLEDQGVLVRRSRELLESEIGHFMVIERDGMIVACAALYPFGDRGELACLVTHPDYRDDDRGERLLKVIEDEARKRGMVQLFALTTQTEHWFVEHGFTRGEIDSLPSEKRALYNYQRNSRMLEKDL